MAGRCLHADPGGFGLLGPIGVGAALGPLLLTRLTTSPCRPALVFGPYLLRGLTDLILAAPRSPPVAMGAPGLYGVGTSTGMVSYNSLLQAEVSSRNRGRVFAGYDMVWQTGRLISLGAGGLTAMRWASRLFTCSAAAFSCSPALSAWPGFSPSPAPASALDHHPGVAGSQRQSPPVRSESIIIQNGTVAPHLGYGVIPGSRLADSRRFRSRLHAAW